MTLFASASAITPLKPLAFISLFSYPLYLLQQDIGLIKPELLNEFDGRWPHLIVMLGFLIWASAHLAHRLVEYRYQKALRRELMKKEDLQQSLVASNP